MDYLIWLFVAKFYSPLKTPRSQFGFPLNRWRSVKLDLKRRENERNIVG